MKHIQNTNNEDGFTGMFIWINKFMYIIHVHTLYSKNIMKVEFTSGLPLQASEQVAATH